MARHRMTFQFAWPWSGTETNALFAFLFQISVTTFLGLLMLERLVPGFVSDWWDVNILLWPIGIFGLTVALWPTLVHEHGWQRSKKSIWRDGIILLVIAGVISGLVWSGTEPYGRMGKIVAVVAGLAVVCLAFILYSDDDA